MAGDWIKIEENMTEKPEVFQMAAILGIDPDAVAGKLLRMWAWASRNCNGDGVTNVTVRPLLNRISGVTNFVEAMLQVGWLVIEGEDLIFPKFKRHCSKTSKERANANRRVTEHRKCNGQSVTNVTVEPLQKPRKCNGQSVTNVTVEPLQKPLPEKRREENIELLSKDNNNSPISSIDEELLLMIWKRCPNASKERSSKKQLKDEWQRISKTQRPSYETIDQALTAWNQSQKWKDGFAEGIHLWVKNRQWENIPQIAANNRKQLTTYAERNPNQINEVIDISRLPIFNAMEQQQS